MFPERLRGFQTSPCASSLWSPLRGSAAKLMLGICLKACLVFGALDSRYTTMSPRQTAYMPSLTASLYGVGIVSVCSRTHAEFTKSESIFPCKLYYFIEIPNLQDTITRTDTKLVTILYRYRIFLLYYPIKLMFTFDY